mmetsp:Transcript_38374/g.91884  ORF Transcript_38374/g.91884 Transcript_38374/m.91884 type:complete len:242 (-) Transcript_38374:444-1169(-)
MYVVSILLRPRNSSIVSMTSRVPGAASSGSSSLIATSVSSDVDLWSDPFFVFDTMPLGMARPRTSKRYLLTCCGLESMNSPSPAIDRALPSSSAMRRTRPDSTPRSRRGLKPTPVASIWARIDCTGCSMTSSALDSPLDDSGRLIKGCTLRRNTRSSLADARPRTTTVSLRRSSGSAAGTRCPNPARIVSISSSASVQCGLIIQHARRRSHTVLKYPSGGPAMDPPPVPPSAVRHRSWRRW